MRGQPIWLITTTGFYSVLEKPRDQATGTLTARARAHADLESLRDANLPELGEIRKGLGADYRHRAQAPPKRWPGPFRRR